MTDEIKEESKSSSQKRSAVYPRYPLQEALMFAQAIYNLGSDNVAQTAVALEIDKPINSSAFLGRISSAKQFGLIISEGNTLSITKLAKRIVQEVGDEDKQQALVESFSMPPLYKLLINNFNGKNLPKKETLGNILANSESYRIQDNARINAASGFFTSAEFAGVLKNGMLVVPQINTGTSDNNDQKEEPENLPPKTPFQTFDVPKFSPPAPPCDTNQYHTFDFDGGIELRIPKTKKSNKAVATGLTAVYEELEKFAKLLVEE